MSGVAEAQRALARGVVVLKSRWERMDCSIMSGAGIHGMTSQADLRCDGE